MITISAFNGFRSSPKAKFVTCAHVGRWRKLGCPTRLAYSSRESRKAGVPGAATLRPGCRLLEEAASCSSSPEQSCCI